MIKMEKEKELAKLSSLRIGGRAKYYVSASSLDDIFEALSFAKREKIPFFILGNGTNILFDDRGFSGIVIHNRVDYFSIEKECIEVGAGLSLPLFVKKCIVAGIQGMEFASQIPGTIGGALFMNAGAFGKELSQFLENVEYVTPDGTVKNGKKEDLFFGYRSSFLQKEKGIAIKAFFSIEKMKSSPFIPIEEFQKKRKKSQPQNVKSAGSIFKNPTPSISAGLLIEKSGGKTLSVGDAHVSEKHANFLINKENATAKDFLALIDRVQKQVKEKTGYTLEKELRYLSYEGKIL